MWSHCKHLSALPLNADNFTSPSQGGTVAIHFMKQGLLTYYFSVFSSFQMISQMKLNNVIPFKQEQSIYSIPCSILENQLKVLIQWAVSPLCLQHTGSLLISQLSGEAVIIWGWASTMDNYPGKRISNCGENTAFSKRSWMQKKPLMASSKSLSLRLSICLTPSCDLDQLPTKHFKNHSTFFFFNVILYLVPFRTSFLMSSLARATTTIEQCSVSGHKDKYVHTSEHRCIHMNTHQCTNKYTD